MLKIENVKNRNIATIRIRGFNEKSNVLIEKFARRGVKAVVDALKEGALPTGITKIAIAEKIRKKAMHEERKMALAMQEFANALEDVVKILAYNMGYDKDLTIADMKKKLKEGEIEGLYKNGEALRSYLLEKSEIEKAGETAISIIRISDVLSRKPLVKGTKYSSSRVIIYTSTGCPYCAKAKAYLRSKGVAFKEINVSENPSGLQVLIKKN